MDRIKADGNVGNKFVEENLAQNIPGTLMSAKWCNDVQEELVAILSTYSVALSPTAQNQIATLLKTRLSEVEKRVNLLEAAMKDTVASLNSVITFINKDLVGIAAGSPPATNAKAVYKLLAEAINISSVKLGEPTKTVDLTNPPASYTPGTAIVIPT